MQEGASPEAAKTEKTEEVSAVGSKGNSSHPPSERGSIAPSLAPSEGKPKSEEEKRPPEEINMDLLGLDNPAADLRNMRRIIAEDQEWSLAVVPELTELSLNTILADFANNSQILKELLPKHQALLLTRIPTSLPLQITAPLIDDEGYWQRCCRARWEVCDVTAHGGSWKRLFFERHAQGLIELFVPDTTDPTELQDVLKLGADVIRKLDIRQLLPPVKMETSLINAMPDESSDADSDSEEEKECNHFEFGPVVKVLTQLQELHLTYGVQDCGMNFEWKLFLFKQSDCLKLAVALATCTTLRVFRLHRSKVDDERVRVLICHLLDHPTLEELDLSYNIISDRGARAVGMFINRSQLVRLNLLDNNIRGPGAMALAHALVKNSRLQTLNLRHNHFSDEGGQAVCRALMKNRTLLELNLSSNDLGEPTATMLSQALMANCTLRSLDLSCNRLGLEGGRNLREGLEHNSCITAIDLRLTECGQESEYNINLILFRNQEATRDAAVKEREAAAPPQRKEADPQAAHRFVLPPDLVY